MRTLAAFALLLFAVIAPAHAQMLPITATNITDASGAPFTGKLGFTPVASPGGPPIAAQQGNGGQILPYTRYFPVVGGTLQGGATLADTAVTSPVNLCYRVTYRYAGMATAEADSGVLNSCFQPSSAALGSTNLSTAVQFVNPALPVVQTGPRGIPGQIAIGTVSTLPAGAAATAVNVGTPDQAVINIGVPQGLPGTTLGVKDATLFTGGDIGAKVNAAISTLPSSGGDIFIPAGTYTFSTSIVIRNGNQHIECGRGTVLRYTGSADAIVFTSNPPQGGAMLSISGSGGCLLDGSGASPGANGIRIMPSNSATVSGMNIQNFANGAAVYLQGANAVQIDHSRLANSKYGIYEVSSGQTSSGPYPYQGSSGYSVNAAHVFANEISDNQWGVYSDNGGVPATRNLGNTYESNSFEGNTTGDLRLGWDAETWVSHNYFESVGVGVSAGVGSDNVFSVHVVGNYFTTNAYRSDVEIGSGWDFFVEGNYEEGGAAPSSNCAVNIVPQPNGGATNVVVRNAAATHSESAHSAYQVCTNGTPDSTRGVDLFSNNVQVDGVISSNAPPVLFSTMTSYPSVDTIIGRIGALSIHASQSNPGGTCLATAAALWFSPSGMFVCQAGNWVQK